MKAILIQLVCHFLLIFFQVETFDMPKLSLKKYVFDTSPKVWHIYIRRFDQSVLEKFSDISLVCKFEKTSALPNYFCFIMNKTRLFAKASGLHGGSIRWDNRTWNSRLET